MINRGTLEVSDPASVQRKTITFDRKKFATALAKAVLNGIPVGFSMAAGQPNPAALAKMGENIVDLVASFGLKTTPDRLASKLIFTAASQAAFELVREAVREESKGDTQPTMAALNATLTQSEPEALVTMLEQRLTAEPLEIDRHFFKDPAKPLPIAAIAEVLAYWLDNLGLTRPQTQAIANRFERYFVYAVYDEWKSKANDYAPLLQGLETPFDEALAWERYWAHLRRQVQLPMMAEPFGLDAVYVPLRAYFVTKTCPDGECEQARDIFRRGLDDKKSIATQHIVKLHRAVHDWLGKNDKDDAIRLICGGPGSGKSSFVKMLAADLAGNEQRLLFVPLAQKDPSKDLKQMIGEFLQGSGLLPFNPMEERDKPLLLILDGLDELSMQGRSGAEAAKQLLDEVRSAVGIANYDTLCVRCLITGRDLAVQAVEQALHLETTSLHLLPYWIDGKKETPNPSDPENLLEEDQRSDWWRKYGQASGHGFDSVPKPFLHARLREMSGQPLLNYLLAVIYTQNPKAITEASRAPIYNRLLSGVYDRDYNKAHFPLGALKSEEFSFVLEKIAVAIWHGDGRTASLGEIKAHCHGSQAEPLLERVLAGVDKGLMRLLTAFYFRQAMQRGESETFEFTHKSFGEYLTARHIVAILAELYEESRRSANSMRSTWSLETALQDWLTLCAPQPMDEYLYSFIYELVAEEPLGAVRQWQQLCARLIGIVLDQGMPMGPRPEGLSFKAQCQQARNAEAALLAVHCACASRTGTISAIVWPTPKSLREWLSWLEPAAGPTLARKGLAHLELKQQELAGVNLHSANLKEVDLMEANLMGANLMGANLMGANLEGANLVSADLWRANLMGAVLGEANLKGASFASADLEGANLERANLKGANFARAYLTGAYLMGARIGSTVVSNELFIQAEFDDPALREALRANVDISQLEAYRIGEPDDDEADALARLIEEARATQKKN
ncbi:NACHT domain-containing protein [Desulfovibrio aerotolerans]|uniref:NACHT domain-containing protein n=1 Tax=Solidesulfovibrio aerotolerans TaxID=295255 RepID=A0A7C9IMM5_9BACT|nr:pentapeptide repeat-containing protein [Solidesulfovibrio aerotolerans]MYL84681.1 NACHT domain-containing protein [Solidesulfovibrio aerotolerans]